VDAVLIEPGPHVRPSHEGEIHPVVGPRHRRAGRARDASSLV
jgi:hypothetical protein